MLFQQLSSVVLIQMQLLIRCLSFKEDMMEFCEFTRKSDGNWSQCIMLLKQQPQASEKFIQVGKIFGHNSLTYLNNWKRGGKTILSLSSYFWGVKTTFYEVILFFKCSYFTELKVDSLILVSTFWGNFSSSCEIYVWEPLVHV